tara:strand:- start:1203 stop:2102 length:900 start_codon:yes stop_codon:yes gene_type:complete
MCGIVGLFIKNPEMQKNLGKYLSKMLIEMTERGPDSTGIAIYRDPVESGWAKLTALAPEHDYSWEGLICNLGTTFGDDYEFDLQRDQALLKVSTDVASAQIWVREKHPELRINGAGEAIEIFKAKGTPAGFVEKFELEGYYGSHALGHTRMATESAVTTEHSHPFSTGADLCLVHNGSLSNHNQLREELRREGIRFQTDNDSEVAAGYLAWRMREGDSLDTSLRNALNDLDGFYTFAVGTKDGFAVLVDPIGCKPAVMAETDDWAAMSSEFRAIATLPGAGDAKIWEPIPSKIYSWFRT